MYLIDLICFPDTVGKLLEQMILCLLQNELKSKKSLSKQQFRATEAVDAVKTAGDRVKLDISKGNFNQESKNRCHFLTS